MCLEMMPSWCGQVNWGNCGILWVNCAVLCVKDDWTGPFWGLRYCLSKLRSLFVFRSGMTSHNKIAQFNWQCIARLILTTDIVCVFFTEVSWYGYSRCGTVFSLVRQLHLQSSLYQVSIILASQSATWRQEARLDSLSLECRFFTSPA